MCSLQLGTNDLTAAILQAIACGTFLYLGFEALQAIGPESGGSHHHNINTSTRAKAILCCVFLSVHSILDGIVIGSSKDNRNAAVLCFAISMHKFWAGLALGFKLEHASKIRKPPDDRDDRHFQEHELDEIEGKRSPFIVSSSQESHAFIKDDLRWDSKTGNCTETLMEYSAFAFGFTVLALLALAV